MTRFHPPALFDWRRDFVAIRPVQINGQKLAPGQAFDKNMVDERRLRQLYDRHDIGYAPEGELEGERPVREGALGPVVLGNQSPPEPVEDTAAAPSEDAEVTAPSEDEEVVPRRKRIRASADA